VNKKTLDILTFFIGVSFAYGTWLVWKKLTELIGDSNIVLVIIIIIVSFGVISGIFSYEKIIDKFA